MIVFDSIVLYVEDIVVSGRFYAELLGCRAQELSPTFLSFELDAGLKLELKTRAKAEPPTSLTGGGTELCIKAGNAAVFDELFELWKGRGITFVQQPTTLVFGRTFVAADPDGHRLRVFAQG